MVRMKKLKSVHNGPLVRFGRNGQLRPNAQWLVSNLNWPVTKRNAKKSLNQWDIKYELALEAMLVLENVMAIR